MFSCNCAVVWLLILCMLCTVHAAGHPPARQAEERGAGRRDAQDAEGAQVNARRQWGSFSRHGPVMLHSPCGSMCPQYTAHLRQQAAQPADLQTRCGCSGQEAAGLRRASSRGACMHACGEPRFFAALCCKQACGITHVLSASPVCHALCCMQSLVCTWLACMARYSPCCCVRFHVAACVRLHTRCCVAQHAGLDATASRWGVQVVDMQTHSHASHAVGDTTVQSCQPCTTAQRGAPASYKHQLGWLSCLSRCSNRTCCFGLINSMPAMQPNASQI